MRIAPFFALLLLLPACTPHEGQLAALRAKNPQVDTFPQAMASEYLAYAQSLAEEGHPIRSNYFAGKGLTVLEKGDVAPEEKASLAEQRASLVQVLTPDVKEVAPTKAARAQLLFDCWTESEAVCRETFGLALSDLQSIADALVHEGDNRFEIRFAPKTAELSAENNGIIAMAAARVKKLGEYKVVIEPAKSLAEKRTLAVKKALIAKGVNAGKIEQQPAGKGKEVVLSIDAKSNPDRVVISINTFTQPVQKATP